jgi:NTP pyrophosphatase (non-canonical NTP hydrolase)
MKFRDERDWARYHHALDLAVAMNIECAEVLEHLRFKSREEAKEYLSNPENKKEFSHEIADIFIFMLALCNSEGIDLEKAFTEKLEINRKKYPIEKAYGIKDKYDKLR